MYFLVSDIIICNADVGLFTHMLVIALLVYTIK